MLKTYTLKRLIMKTNFLQPVQKNLSLDADTPSGSLCNLGPIQRQTPQGTPCVSVHSDSPTDSLQPTPHHCTAPHPSALASVTSQPTALQVPASLSSPLSATPHRDLATVSLFERLSFLGFRDIDFLLLSRLTSLTLSLCSSFVSFLLSPRNVKFPRLQASPGPTPPAFNHRRVTDVL